MKRPHRCNYCERPAVVWAAYRGYIRRPGHVGQRPLLYVAACAEHEGCPNWASNLSLNPDSVITRGAK